MAAADVAVAATGVGSATGLRLYPFTLSASDAAAFAVLVFVVVFLRAQRPQTQSQ